MNWIYLVVGQDILNELGTKWFYRKNSLVLRWSLNNILHQPLCPFCCVGWHMRFPFTSSHKSHQIKLFSTKPKFSFASHQIFLLSVQSCCNMVVRQKISLNAISRIFMRSPLLISMSSSIIVSSLSTYILLTNFWIFLNAAANISEVIFFCWFTRIN